MPVLTIIAGPNGAGKSTHSEELLTDFGIGAFDFDKEFYAIWSEFNFDSYIEQGAVERAQKLFIDRKSAAAQKKQNFALETTYHTHEALPVVEMFRSKQYHTELIFICLDSPDIAVERVKDRVAKGGHSVEEGIIRKRFAAGLTELDGTFDQYDLVSIYLSRPNDVKAVALLEPRRNKAISISPFPAAMIPLVPKLTEFLEKNM